MKTVKENLFAMLLCIALILPLAPIGAQESDNFWSDAASSDKNHSDSAETAAPKPAAETASPKAESETTAVETTTPKTATPKTSGQTPSLKLPKIDGAKTANTAFNKVIGYISQIGSVFGKTTGKRIGGTSVSAIALLVIAKLIQDRGPSWLRWVLYLSGGTMVAGSGANITQMIMQFLS